MEFKADRELRECIKKKIDEFKKNVHDGHPYVWELRLTEKQFDELEEAIKKSICVHGQNHDHLLEKEYAPIAVVYLAEWYKRKFDGGNANDVALKLGTSELQKLIKNAGIDQKFIYQAKKNKLWKDSLQVLGGLALKEELKRDSGDKLLQHLCAIMQNEQADLNDLKDANRASVFQQSIEKEHSLYHYLLAILDPDRKMPFAAEDLEDPNSDASIFIRRIKSAAIQRHPDKFTIEWLISYNGVHKEMVRSLVVHLIPEDKGGPQYLPYERLRVWGLQNPEQVGRVSFYVKFTCGGQDVLCCKDSPLFTFHNTGSDKTGFLCVGGKDESVHTQVPAKDFDKVEIRLTNNDALVQSEEFEVPIQLYLVPKTANKFSSLQKRQTSTVVLFPTTCEPSVAGTAVEYARFKYGEEMSEEYCWCCINEQVTLVEKKTRNAIGTYYNRCGQYQLVIKKYPETIKYVDNDFVRHIYKENDKTETREELPALFGRCGIEIYHIDKNGVRTLKPWEELEWKQQEWEYTKWDGQNEPKLGSITFRVTMKDDTIMRRRVFYVPFEEKKSYNVEADPIYRDCVKHRIVSNIKDVKDVEDDFPERTGVSPEPDTKEIEIVSTEDKDKIIVSVYRPYLRRELWQKGGTNIVVDNFAPGQNIRIPLIYCDQFTVRDFTDKGVSVHPIEMSNSLWYKFTTIDACTKNQLLQSRPINGDVELYLCNPMDNASYDCGWDYTQAKAEPYSSSSAGNYDLTFKSLKQTQPRHYPLPLIKERDIWGDGPARGPQIDPLTCFLEAAKHKTYFFLFAPLVDAVNEKKHIKEIVLPLIKKRDYKLLTHDKENLYRFALHFHFDWMLMRRNMWEDAINAFAQNQTEKDKMKEAVVELFRSTPKCTSQVEQEYLDKFLKQYWTFTAYPSSVKNIPETALKLILSNDAQAAKAALSRYTDGLRGFLMDYDDYRSKFVTMSKAYKQ